MRAKLILTIIFCMLCSSALHAAYDEANLNKLFTDKRQRAQIDAARSGNYVENESQQKTTNKVSVSGYMKRSDGKSVVWVNGKSTMEKSTVGDVKVYQSSIGKNKKVTISVDGISRQLKPGEVWHKDTGVIVDK